MPNNSSIFDGAGKEWMAVDRIHVPDGSIITIVKPIHRVLVIHSESTEINRWWWKSVNIQLTIENTNNWNAYY